MALMMIVTQEVFGMETEDKRERERERYRERYE